jgi:hypothetical protein
MPLKIIFSPPIGAQMRQTARDAGGERLIASNRALTFEMTRAKLAVNSVHLDVSLLSSSHVISFSLRPLSDVTLLTKRIFSPLR